MKKNCFLLPIILLFSTLCFSQEKTTANVFSEYGSKVGVGFTILDGIGIPVRIYPNPNVVFELGLGLGGITGVKKLNYKDEVSELHLGVKPFIGLSFFGNRFEKTRKEKLKVRANGVAFHAGYLVGSYKTISPSIAWAQETFRQGNTKKSFIFELGFQYYNHIFKYNPSVFYYSEWGPYLRCVWNTFQVKKSTIK
jgi:hypothetical protein